MSSPSQSITTLLRSNPGVQRDSTIFSSECYTNAQWCRFVNGMPTKIGGYTMAATGTSEIVRSLSISDGLPFDVSDITSLAYIGRSASLSTLLYNPNIMQNYQEIDVTPPESAVGYTETGFFEPYNDSPALLNLWTFAAFTLGTNTINETTYVFAHVAPNANNVANTITGTWSVDNDQNQTANVFYQVQQVGGVVQQNSQFLPLFVSFPPSSGQTKLPPDTIGPPYQDTYIPDPGDQNGYTSIIALTNSGGIIAVYPYLFVYGANGVVSYSSAAAPFEFPGTNIEVIADTKIVAGRSTRGSGTPNVIFWSLNSVVVGQLQQQVDGVGEDEAIVNTFSFNTVAGNCSILSAGSIVEYNQCFYWVGNDEFYMYSGVVTAVPNSMNKNYFFNNLNNDFKSKVWGMLIPRYSEIWWFYPSVNNNECDSVIIFNVKDNIWYDTLCSRSAGTMPILENSPLMASSRATRATSDKFPLWNHEIGVDEVRIGPVNLPIASLFRTHVFNFAELSGQPNSNQMMLVQRIEPDFDLPIKNTPPENFVNDMLLYVWHFNYVTDINYQIFSNKMIFSFNKNQPYIDILVQGGLIQFEFYSYKLGGQYQLGKTLLTYAAGDSRRG